MSYRPPPGAPDFPPVPPQAYARSHPSPAVPPQVQHQSVPVQQPNLVQLEHQYHEQLVAYYDSFLAQGLLAPVADDRQAKARDDAVSRREANRQRVQHAVPERPNSWPSQPVYQHQQQPQQQQQQQQQQHVPFPSTSQHPAYASPQPHPSTSSSPAGQHARPLPRPTSVSLHSSVSRPARPSYQQQQVAPARQQSAPTSWDEIGASLASRRPIAQSDVGVASPYSGVGAAGTRSDVGMQSSGWSEVGTIGSGNGGSQRATPSPRRPPLPAPPTAGGGLPQRQPLPPPPQSSTPSPRPALPTPPSATTSANGRSPLPTPKISVGPSIFTPEDHLQKKMSQLGLSSPSPPPSISSPRHPLPSPSISFPSSTPPPRLHPRSDPSHPSHSIYHPTSSSSLLTLEAGTVTCRGCGKPLFGRALTAAGSPWHPDCFICEEGDCDEKLEHVQFEEKEGKVWCMLHYEEQFGMKCFHCKTPIAEESFLTVSDPRLRPSSPSTRHYHSLHFFCSSCGDPFVDPKSLSPAKGKEETEAAPYMVHNGYAYCQNCDIKLWREKCRGCRKGVGGDWVEPDGEEGGKWHPGCFTCFRCRKPLDGEFLLKDADEDEPPPPSKRGIQPPPGPLKVYCIPCFHLESAQDARRKAGI